MIGFEHLGLAIWRLTTSQFLPLPPEEVFPFFEDPRNLAAITPPWLDFRLLRADGTIEVFEGAEFACTIRWLGRKILWRSRISDYRPPERFTDIQIRGPYVSWEHRHTFERVKEGSLMRDEVRYRLPFIALPLSRLIRRQLEDIFAYRAGRIEQWVRREMARKSPLAGGEEGV